MANSKQGYKIWASETCFTLYAVIFSEDVELWLLMFYDFVLRCVQWLDATTR